uniref:CSON000905 protein n=1 Tax=Culicoides sonorensis TaxID=179676 RepID=A0A336LQC7_CULSO
MINIVESTYLIRLWIFVAIIVLASSLPVDPKPKKPDSVNEIPDTNEKLENVLEYERYLKEVVNLLESDKDFREKLDKADEADIRSGKIAQELEYVNHNVRSKLHELKRQELERLRHLAIKQYELSNGIDRAHIKIPEHLDHENAHTFEIEDLKRLILKTSQDLAENDRKRREEFKEYELQKEFEKQEKLRELDEEHKKQYLEELKKQQEKHNKHEKLHHPGSKDQLEEVWEKQDHMDGQEFDPKAFFMLHDLDGNNFWDENEVKALFIKELDKVYQSGVPEDDLRERAEEMERMREHVFKEADTNHDGLISYQEFLDQTKRDEFQRDPGWDTVDNVPQYTHEEYLEFERRRHEEIQRLIAEGKLPAHPNMPHGSYDPNQIPEHLKHAPPPPPHFQENQPYNPSNQHQVVNLNQNQIYNVHDNNQNENQFNQQQLKNSQPHIPNQHQSNTQNLNGKFDKKEHAPQASQNYNNAINEKQNIEQH